MVDRSHVRRLSVNDAAALTVLRREALETAPLAFAASPEDDLVLLPDFATRALAAGNEEQATFGHLDGDELTGIVGLVRSAKLKQRHVAMIVGLYVTARARGRGAARALLDAAIAQARAWGVEQVQLEVTVAAPAARRLYESMGFRTWGRQPRSLGFEGQFVDEDHMVLDLREGGS